VIWCLRLMGFDDQEKTRPEKHGRGAEQKLKAGVLPAPSGKLSLGRPVADRGGARSIGIGLVDHRQPFFPEADICWIKLRKRLQ